MTNIVYFLPMTRPHRIAIVAYEGCQLLDVTGPAAVFGAANETATHQFYDVAIVSPDGGAVVCNCGVALHSRKIGGQPDTLLVAGGSRGLKAAMEHQDLRRWLRKAAPGARLFTAAVDDGLNDAAYIVPGLGDAGDRQFGPR